MISTPETGVDSIAVTYALLDPIMTVVRPVAAFFTASLTGVFVNILDKEPSSNAITNNSPQIPLESPHKAINSSQKSLSSSMVSASSCSFGGCSCSNKGNIRQGWKAKFSKGMAFAFGDLLNDIGPWLLAGIVLAGIITIYISPEFIESYLGDGFFSMLIMIALATPLYVCATASTPIAAALALKGISPGAALVFLLAGPATNMATITVVSRLLGRKTALIYTGSIMICSLILGLFVNYLYIQMGMDIAGWVQSVGHEEHGIVYMAAAILLLILVARPWLQSFSGTGLIQKMSLR